jgi:hypothetical protein
MKNAIRREIFDAEAERRAIDETLEHFRSVGPAIKRLKDSPEPD